MSVILHVQRNSSDDGFVLGSFCNTMDDDGWLNLTADDAMEWYYRGEGAGNIVLYHLNTNPLLVGKVLRLKKVSSNSNHLKKRQHVRGKAVLSQQEQILWADWPSVASAISIEILVQTYSQNVMRPLLGSEFVDPGVIVSVSCEFLETVASRIENARPSWRAAASQIDPCSHHALLMSDHSVFWSPTGTIEVSGTEKIFPSISVEIKPKCGFLPSSDLIAAKNSVKKEISRFAMHQTLKYAEGQIKKISNYSPLDLFSGNLKRINQAVHDLFENPQNNLRVFIEGRVMFESNADYQSQQQLIKALEDCEFRDLPMTAIEYLTSLVSQSLYENDVLNKLLAVQKLDRYDIEGAFCAYEKMISGEASNENYWVKVNEGLDEETKKKRSEFFDKLSIMDCVKIVKDYLIAATAKDCSLMLTFQRAHDMSMNNSDQHYKLLRCSNTGKLFHLKIRFVDLDLKPLNKMPHYYELDEAIVSAYLHTLEDEST